MMKFGALAGLLAAGLMFSTEAGAWEAKPRLPASGQRAGSAGAVSSPLKLIYRISGVLNNGAANSGTATTILCTNHSAAGERIQYLVYNYAGTLVAQNTYNISSRYTLTVSTHDTKAFPEDNLLAVGISVAGGHIIIASTTNNMECSAMLVDAATAAPSGIALHMLRINPYTGTQE